MQSNDPENQIKKSSAGKGLSFGLAVSLMQKQSDDAEMEEATDQMKSTKLMSAHALAQINNRHADELALLKQQIQQEINDLDLSQDTKLVDIKERQILEAEKMCETHRLNIGELKITQENEIATEDLVHDTEMKALLERKILDNILNTVDDGIISISPVGKILRFNHAAEKIFGWTTDEMLGKNINILMPSDQASKHDGYLQKYLKTGKKNIIGLLDGRAVTGLRKNGTTFPLQLSISELKTDDNHMFTGITRDLTEALRIEGLVKAKDEKMKKELEALVVDLDKSKLESEDLLSQMMPPSIYKKLMAQKFVEPESFESATVFFLDVVGFTTICSQIPPMDTVALLNGIYNTFDKVIEQYDVYKVETIGTLSI